MRYATNIYYKEKRKNSNLPVGYADGYPRSLSNKGIVYLNKYKYPVVGRMCMDQCMVSIG